MCHRTKLSLVSRQSQWPLVSFLVSMRPAPLSLFLFVVLLLSSSAPTWAQQSVFKARVFDEHEGEALQGVNVAVEGTTLGGATDSDGVVAISGIPTGKQTIVF